MLVIKNCFGSGGSEQKSSAKVLFSNMLFSEWDDNTSRKTVNQNWCTAVTTFKSVSHFLTCSRTLMTDDGCNEPLMHLRFLFTLTNTVKKMLLLAVTGAAVSIHSVHIITFLSQGPEINQCICNKHYDDFPWWIWICVAKSMNIWNLQCGCGSMFSNNFKMSCWGSTDEPQG